MTNAKGFLFATLGILTLWICGIYADSKHKYFPQSKEELQALIKDNRIYLGSIDTSAITDMSRLFIVARGGILAG